MKVLKSFLILCLTLSFMACNNTIESQNPENTEKVKQIDKNVINQWTKQENNDLEIFFPPSWHFDSSGNMGTLFIIMSPLSSETDVFQENISLVVRPLKSYETNTNDYYLSSITDLKQNMPSANIQIEESLINNHIDIRKVIFTASQEEAVLQIQQYYFVHEQNAYIMTFTSEEIIFDDYIEVVDFIMNSFKFK